MATYEGPYSGNGMFKSFTKTWHTEPYPSISPSRPDLTAAGKTVFITGGGSGIGKATAIAFAQAGAKLIAIFGRRIANLQSAAEEIRKANPLGTTTVVFESVDISQRQALDAAFNNAIKKSGGSDKVHIFINNAAAIKPSTTILSDTEKDLREMIEVNIIGSFNSIQAVSPFLAPNAKILNISSGVAHVNPMPGMWSYSAVKTAVAKMFDFLQSENKEWDVFNIQPGVVTTELNSVSDIQGQDDGEFDFVYPSTHLLCR